MYCYKAAAWILVLALSGSPVAAQVPWLLSLGAQVDDDGSAGYGVGVDVGVTDSTWLSFYGGLARSPDELADVTTRSLVVGIDQRWGPVGFTLGLESWGEPDEVESRDLSGSWYVRGERYRVAVKGERRDIDIGFTVTTLDGAQLQRSASVTAEGFGAALSVDLAPRWRLVADGIGFNYSRNLTLLPRLQTFDFLASSALTLANSFIDTEFAAGIEYDLDSRVFSMQWRRDRSAVDGSNLRSVNLAALFPVANRWDLELALGMSDADELDRALFGGVYLFFYGGG